MGGWSWRWHAHFLQLMRKWTLRCDWVIMSASRSWSLALFDRLRWLLLFLHVLQLLRLWSRLSRCLLSFHLWRWLLLLVKSIEAETCCCCSTLTTKLASMVDIRCVLVVPPCFCLVAFIVFVKGALHSITPRGLTHWAMERAIEVNLSLDRGAYILTIERLVEARIFCFWVFCCFFGLNTSFSSNFCFILTECMLWNVRPHWLVVFIWILRRLISCNTTWWYRRIWRRQLPANGKEISFWSLLCWTQLKMCFTSRANIFSLTALWAPTSGASTASLIWNLTIAGNAPWVWIVLSLRSYHIWCRSGSCTASSCSFTCSFSKAWLLHFFCFKYLVTCSVFPANCPRSPCIYGIIIFKLNQRQLLFHVMMPRTVRTAQFPEISPLLAIYQFTYFELGGAWRLINWLLGSVSDNLLVLVLFTTLGLVKILLVTHVAVP